MKRNGTRGQLGRAILISLLAFAVDLRAQNLSAHRPPIGGQESRSEIIGATPHQSQSGSRENQGIERIAEAEWVRGYRDGYELGFWTGVHDVRAFLPPVTRPPGYDARTRNTPYRQGYFTGYANGYRHAFSYPWHLRP